MPEVKWIKITTDMFDNRKIKHLRRLPEGDSIVLIWVMLLTMAGRCNAGGMIFLTENIPYTPKMLADELDFEESTVRLAIESLECLGMIATDAGGFMAVPGWGEYQNIDGLDKIREQTRKRVAAHRARKTLEPCNDDCNVTVTQCNATDIDLDLDKKEEKEYKDMGESAPARIKRFSPPTVEEVSAYCAERKNGLDAQRFVDYYAMRGWMLGKSKMKDWKAAVRTWERNDKERKAVKNNGSNREADYSEYADGRYGILL